jgi:hypothetical protein
MEVRKLFDPSGLRFLAVAGAKDQFVPPESSLSPFANECCRTIAGDHVSMLDAESVRADCVQLLKAFLTRSKMPPPAPMKPAQEMSEKEAIAQALALDATRGWDEAMALLKSRPQLSTDGMGVLAGRYKRRWWFDNRDADAQEAMRLYTDAYRRSLPPDYVPDQAYYHAINLAYLHLAFGRDRDTAGHYARQAMRHCQSDRQHGCEHWRLATEADALFLLGEPAPATEKYEAALKLAKPLRDRASILTQAGRLGAALQMERGTESRLRELFTEHSY